MVDRNAVTWLLAGSSLGEDLTVLRGTGREAMNELSSFIVEVLSPEPIDPTAALGSAATLTIVDEADELTRNVGLLVAMRDPDPAVRAFAAESVGSGQLAERFDPSAFDRLFADDDARVRAAAALSAGALQGHADRIRPALQALLKKVKRAAKEALEMLEGS